MKKRRILALGLTAALSVGLLAGCGGGTQPTETSPTGGETTPVETGAVTTGANEIRVCFASEPETMDPTMNRTVDGNVMISHLFEGLYKWVDSDPSGDGRDGADDYYRGRAQLLAPRDFGQRAERAFDAALARGRPALYGGGGGVGRHARLRQRGADVGQRRRAHEEEQRPAEARERGVVCVGYAAVLRVRRDYVQRGSEAAVRHGDARGRGRGYRRRYARHDLELYIFLFQRLYLLAAAPEDKGVAALDPGHVLSLQRLLHQKGVRLELAQMVLIRPLARVDQLRVSLCFI